jgi:formylmethanofuran dehydrogenase subunit C
VVPAGGLAELTMTRGTITVHGNRVTITYGGDTLSGTLSLDGNVLTIDIPSFEFFDDIYRLVMVFRRG